MAEQLFPFWDLVPVKPLRRSEMKRLEKHNWYVRLAERSGFIPARDASKGVPQLMVALKPKVFTSVAQARTYAKHRPFDLVARYWSPDPITGLSVRPVAALCWVPVLVDAANEKQALSRLKSALPRNVEIEGAEQ